MAEEPRIAVFVDFENLALGSRGMGSGGFDISLVLKRLLEKGRIVFKRAYCDWGQYRQAVRDFHAQGIELVDIPHSKMSGKNSADIHMVVDAVDLCYSKQHIDIFALLTGDSDFSPLVSKLKENDKRVIGCGVKQSSSQLLIANCDEFIYFDDLVRESEKGSKGRRRKDQDGDRDKSDAADSADANDSDEPDAIVQLMEIVRSLDQDYDMLWGSMIKQAIKRVYPGFNERYSGYQNFPELLKDAEKRGYVELDYDRERGNYLVRLGDY